MASDTLTNRAPACPRFTLWPVYAFVALSLEALAAVTTDCGRKAVYNAWASRRLPSTETGPAAVARPRGLQAFESQEDPRCRS
jgi:hypothetical protein